MRMLTCIDHCIQCFRSSCVLCNSKYLYCWTRASGAREHLCLMSHRKNALQETMKYGATILSIAIMATRLVTKTMTSHNLLVFPSMTLLCSSTKSEYLTSCGHYPLPHNGNSSRVYMCIYMYITPRTDTCICASSTE